MKLQRPPRRRAVYRRNGRRIFGGHGGSGGGFSGGSFGGGSFGGGGAGSRFKNKNIHNLIVYTYEKSTIIVIVVIVLIAIWGITSYNGMVKWMNLSAQRGAM